MFGEYTYQNSINAGSLVDRVEKMERSVNGPCRCDCHDGSLRIGNAVHPAANEGNRDSKSEWSTFRWDRKNVLSGISEMGGHCFRAGLSVGLSFYVSLVG